MSFLIGQKVLVRNELGIVRFLGQTQFATGTWVGIELDTASGKNNGTVNDVKYFDCEKVGTYGIFVRPPLVQEILDTPLYTTKPSNLHIIIDKLQQKLHIATTDIKIYKEKIGGLEEELKFNSKALYDVENRLEMTIVDKDFVTDARSDLQTKLEDLQLKYDELRTDHQIILEELELNKEIEQEVESQMAQTNFSSADIQIILKRNRQLEQALIDLQSLFDQSDLRLKEEIEALTLKLGDNETALGNFEEISKKLTAAEITIESLKVQLDSALDLERIIENLNSKNLALTNEIETLNKTVEELTELHELDKSLEESQSLVEADLRADLKSLKEVVRGERGIISDLEKKNKYIQSKLNELKNAEHQKPQKEFQDLELEVENLKLQVKKHKLNSHVDSIASEVAQARLGLLQQRLNSGTSYKLQYKQIFEVVFQLKTMKSLCKIIISYSSPEAMLLKFHINILNEFLEVLLVLWEYNFGNKELQAICKQHYDLLSDLDLSLNSIINMIKESHLNADLGFITRFISASSKLVKLGINSDYIFTNKLYLRFLSYATNSSLQNCIELLEKNSSRTHESIRSVLLDYVELEEKSKKQLEELREINGTQDIKLDDYDFIDTIEIFHKPVETLLEILNVSDNVIYEINGVLEILEDFREVIGVQFIVYSVTAQAFSLALEDPQEDKQVHATNGDDFKLKFEDASTRLLEKDRLLHDLELNVQLLENNMKSFSQIHGEELFQLKNEISKTKKELTDCNDRYQQIMVVNEHLKEELQKLEKANQLFEFDDLLGKFSNLDSENLHTQRLALVEEVRALRKLAVYQQKRAFTEAINLSPMTLQPIVIQKSAVGFQTCSLKIRNLALNTKAIKLSSHYEWTPKSDIPKYINLTIKEQYAAYKDLRNAILRD